MNGSVGIWFDGSQRAGGLVTLVAAMESVFDACESLAYVAVLSDEDVDLLLKGSTNSR